MIMPVYESVPVRLRHHQQTERSHSPNANHNSPYSWDRENKQTGNGYVIGSIMLESAIDNEASTALINPITVEEARAVHNKIMSYLFQTKHKFLPEEAAIMGEFVTRGMAMGFLAGVSTALFARRHSALKKHPNLLGFAVAGTVDAISRDYRRPMVYDKLLKIDSPLAHKARTILYSIRTGSEEPTTMVQLPPRNGPSNNSYSGSDRVVTTESKSEPDAPQVDWWNPPPTEATGVEDAPTASLGYPAVKLPPGGPFKGTRTWADIRNQNQPKSD